jgi:tetratricopeptide (TPR) repeat protein
MDAELPSPLDQVAALCEQGRLSDAEQVCRSVLQATPDDAEALHLLGLIALQRGDSDQAVRLINEAAAAAPQEAKYHINLSAVLGQAGRRDEALETARQVVALHPDYPEAHNNLGSGLVRLGHCEEALASYDRAIALRPNYDEAHYNRGVALQSLKRYEEAAASYQQTIALQTDYLEAYNNLGIVLAELGRFDEALANYEQVIALDPEYDEAFYNRGYTLQSMERHEAAIASYDRALALRPDYAEALKNRGMTLQALDRYDEALADYDRSIALRPDHAPAHFAKGACLLQSGDLSRGWREYEWRWRTPELMADWRQFAQPLWRGDASIRGKTILLHAEQGLGDTLQFCRFVPQVAACGARVILEVHRPLSQLLASLPGAVQIVVRGESLPLFDLHCPLLSLPLALGTTLKTIPSASYLAADPDQVADWRQRTAALTGFRVGVVWAGAPGQVANHLRSIALELLTPLAAVPGVRFVSLQKGDAAGQVRQSRALTLHDFTSELDDFADTAALVATLDLVISVDTSVAHLAAAMGKPTWLLTRFDACWRWLRGREDSPWYPTLRLFRQTKPGDWEVVVTRVGAALAELAGSHGNGMSTPSIATGAPVDRMAIVATRE